MPLINSQCVIDSRDQKVKGFEGPDEASKLSVLIKMCLNVYTLRSGPKSYLILKYAEFSQIEQML